jgi:gliding motility-associated-like protein
MMNNCLKGQISFLLLFIFSQIAYAQPITVVDGNTAPYTPENLITNVFLGQGVTVNEVEFFGDPLSVGYFDEAFSAIGIQRGVVMSSGRVSSLNGGTGIDNPGSSFASYNSNTSVGDSDLDDILGSLSEQDVCKYKIKFVPTSDTLEFNFVWASEEYPEYACSAFNDVFGFFISGPGFNGPYENNAENIALIPGTIIPISIDNVHPQNGPNCPPVNEQYYIDNNGSSVQPVYDGYTQVFTARAIVTPCEEYEIKLAIADAGDEIFDSGVFLEAKSFGTGTIDVALNTISLNGVIAESCSEGEIVFSVENAPEDDLTVDIDIFGTATEGLDYPTLPAEIIIPGGETSISIPFEAFEDNIDEGEEYIAFAVQRDFCTLDTFYIYIRDNELPELDLGPDIEICEIGEANLMGELPVMLPDPPSFTNQQDFLIDPVGTIIESELEVQGVLPVELGPDMIQSVCINLEHNWISDIDIYLQSPDGFFMELVTDVGSNGDDFVQTCFVPGATLDIDYVDPPLSGAPYTGEFNPEGVWSDLGYGSTTNGTWTLLVVDDSEGFEGTLLDWTITFEPVYDIFYSWTPTDGLSCSDCPNPVASPDVTTEYVLEVTDSYGCTASDDIIVEVIPALEAPNVTCIVTAPDCIEFSWDPVNGALAYLVSVDNQPFVASNGATSHTVCGLNLNTEVSIEVVGFDNQCGGYPGSSSCTTPNCDGALPDIEDIGGVLCHGDETGLIELEATGVPPFTFTLGNESNSTGDFYDLPAGTYTIDILDGQNCLESYDFTIPSPDLLTLNLNEEQPINCNGNSNAIYLASVNGGVEPFNYSWSGGNATDELVTDVGAGLLELVVTDANGCSTVSSVNVEEPEPLNIVAIDGFVGCESDDSGVASVIVTGGITPYVYEWDVSSLDTARIDNLPEGAYNISVVDSMGCENTAIVNVNLIPVVIEIESTPASCGSGGGGTLTVNATGGGNFNFYTYQWDSNAGGSTGQTVSNLASGSYNVTVTNFLNNQCFEVGTGIVESSDDIQIEVTTEDPLCWNSSDGTANVEVLLGAYPYTFEWSDAATMDSIRNDLETGVYTVTVTDNDECEAIASIEFEVQDSIELSFVLTEPTCFEFEDGQIEVNASGGTGLYTFDWAGLSNTNTLASIGSGDYVVTVLDENACVQTGSASLTDPDEITFVVSTFDADCFGNSDGSIQVVPSPGLVTDYTILWDDNQSTFTATNLPAGDHGFVIENAAGCTEIGFGTIGEPDVLQLSFDNIDDSCVNSPAGQITAVVEGGTMPYSYSWDGLTGDVAIQSSLTQGNYTLTVTDGNGCIINGSTDISAPEALTVDILPVANDCFEGQTGSASAVLLTGTAPLSYEWSNSTSDPIVTDLSAGTYSVTITDLNDCTVISSFDIVEPEQINIDVDITDPSCFDTQDGMAEVIAVSYGNVPANISDFTFDWIGTSQSSSMATNLLGQDYTVSVTDQLGCVIEEVISLTAPLEMIHVFDLVSPVSCLDESDGSISISTSNGSGPYNYQWGAFSNNQTGNVIDNLSAGLHEVVITDNNGCIANASYNLSEPTGFEYNYIAEPVSCYGYADGSATLFVEGSNNSYTYDWGGQNTQTATELSAGVYDVTVSDILGCSFVAQVEIESPDEIFTSYFKEDIDCHGQNTGKIGLEVSGGNPPFDYTLYPPDDRQADNIFENLTEGLYDVVIEDSKGCEYTYLDIEIDAPAPLVVNLGQDQLLEEITNYVIEGQVSFETNPITYNWSLEGPAEFGTINDNIAELVNIEGRTFVELEVIDENGCITRDNINIFLRKTSVVLVPTGFSPNNDNNNDVLYVHGSEDLKVVSMQIFDRWGGLVFQREGEFDLNVPDLHWDGTFKGVDMPTGAYLWSILVEFKDGHREYFEGSTTLIR